MISYEVELNRERICRAGVGEHGSLVAGLRWRGHRSPSFQLSDQEGVILQVCGFVEGEQGTEEVLEWVECGLSVGDEVTFRVVRAGEADEPAERRVRAKKPCPGPSCAICGQRFTSGVKMFGGRGGGHVCGECVDRLSRSLANDRPPDFGGSAA